MTSTKKIGTLVVVALKARNLAAREVFGKGDPYATFRISDKEERIPADKRGGQHPIWDKEVRFDILETSSHKKMIVKVYNEDKRDPQLIGDRTIDLNEVLTKGEWDEWHELKYGSKYAGEVFLEMTFYAVGGAGIPLQRKKLPSRPKSESPVSSPPPASFIAPAAVASTTSAPAAFVPPNAYPPPVNTNNSNQFIPPINANNSNQYPLPINNNNQYPPPINTNNSNQYPPPINANNSNQYPPPLSVNNSGQFNSIPPINNNNSGQLNSIPPINNNNSGQYAQIANSTAYPPQNIYPPINPLMSPQQNSASFFPPPPIQQGYPPSNNNFGGGYPLVSSLPPSNDPSLSVSFPIPIPTPTPSVSVPNYAYPPQNILGSGYPPQNNLGSGYPPQKN
ncbi:1471_t:CDS:2 [Entrophospora sp. SA101]|nr:7190_t:CDS:2 [Entrophospora sp. SA101]CAJ0651018.1 1471_t:CDS:2 [Entrophospora sp. SA101]CAJ0908410.1 13752_t:CDS:2 [Entrophospora sp. SA101]